jgi:hypothetical protein
MQYTHPPPLSLIIIITIKLVCSLARPQPLGGSKSKLNQESKNQTPHLRFPSTTSQQPFLSRLRSKSAIEKKKKEK